MKSQKCVHFLKSRFSCILDVCKQYFVKDKYLITTFIDSFCVMFLFFDFVFHIILLKHYIITLCSSYIRRANAHNTKN